MLTIFQAMRLAVLCLMESMTSNTTRGTVYVGQSADTPTFAVDNIVRWCQTERLKYWPHATHLMIEADCGGSNG